MKLVLDQELQKYNNLIDIMNDTLKAALSVIDGKSLINDKIEAFIDSLNDGDIPDVWADSAYPTMDDLDGFLDDLKKRTEFLRDWQVLSLHFLFCMPFFIYYLVSCNYDYIMFLMLFLDYRTTENLLVDCTV